MSTSPISAITVLPEGTVPIDSIIQSALSSTAPISAIISVPEGTVQILSSMSEIEESIASILVISLPEFVRFAILFKM